MLGRVFAKGPALVQETEKLHPGHELLRERDESVRLDDITSTHEVRMIEATEQMAFPQEAAALGLVVRQTGFEHLQGDFVSAGLVDRGEDLAHAARTEMALDAVALDQIGRRLLPGDEESGLGLREPLLRHADLGDRDRPALFDELRVGSNAPFVLSLRVTSFKRDHPIMQWTSHKFAVDNALCQWSSLVWASVIKSKHIVFRCAKDGNTAF